MDCEYDNYPTSQNYLFDTAELVKNGDIDKYKYSEHGIGFLGEGLFQ